VTVVSGLTDGGSFRLRTAGALTVGGFDGFDGVTTGGGDISIHAMGDLHLAAAIDTTLAGVTTNSTVRLQATNGTVTQNNVAAGIFTDVLLVNAIGGPGMVVLNSPENMIGRIVVGTAAGGFQVASGNPNVQTNVSVTGDAGLGIIGFNAVPPPPPPPVVDPPPPPVVMPPAPPAMMQPMPPVLVNNCYVEGRQSCTLQPVEMPADTDEGTLRGILGAGPAQVNLGGAPVN
jgi:hypothetical protein